MAEEKKEKSSLGERMSDIGGMRVLRDGKWVLLSEIAKPVPKKKPVTASSYLDNVVKPRQLLPVIIADADYGGKCPPATQDIVLNIENRQNAIDNVGYGPLNPNEPNEDFWEDKADRWDLVNTEDAKKSICGNCVFFDRRPKTLDCIESGIAEGGSGEQSAWDAIDQAELGYCTALDFKCAASRTCNAWAAGGPITEDVKKEEPVAAGGYIVEEEWDLADALVEIAEEHGKFNEDRTGIWAGYKPGKDNKYAEMGVKCGNCVLYRGGSECAIIDFEVEPEGKCRFAVIPDGVVDISKAPVGDDEDVSTGVYFNKRYQKISDEVKARADEEPPYDKYEVDVNELSPTQRTVNMRRVKDAYDSNKPIKVWLTSTGYRVIDGHHRTVAHKLQGKNKIEAEVYSFTDEPITATAGSKPAPKKDRIYGSKKNPKGSASGSKTVNFSKKVEDALSEKVKNHNEKSDRKASLRMLKAVYRRGAGAFSSSHRPDQNRNSWAMARVNAFLHLLKSGSPKNSKYTTDNDLLPASHPKSSKKSVRASGVPTLTPEDQTTNYEDDYSGELTITLLPETEYTSREQAIFALAEYSDAGYEIIPALDAAWNRAIGSDENPFDRAKELATSLYESKDADLLPKEL